MYSGTLFSVMLAMASVTLAAPQQIFIPPKCGPASNWFSSNTQWILDGPVYNYGCSKPGGFCKRGEEDFHHNATAHAHHQAHHSAGHEHKHNATALAQRDQSGGIYMCMKTNWQQCTYNVIPAADMGKCWNLCAGWSNKLNSFGPDAGLTCRLFSVAHCEGGHIDLVKPGMADVGKQWSDIHPASIICHT